MPAILTNKQNQEGARYQLLQVADTDILLFPPQMFWASNMETNANKGDICISSIVGENYRYTNIGTWSNTNGTYILNINGLGIFTFTDKGELNVEIGVAPLKNHIQKLTFKAVANHLYLGSMALKNYLSKLIPPVI